MGRVPKALSAADGTCPLNRRWDVSLKSLKSAAAKAAVKALKNRSGVVGSLTIWVSDMSPPILPPFFPTCIGASHNSAPFWQLKLTCLCSRSNFSCSVRGKDSSSDFSVFLRLGYSPSD